MSDLVFFTEDVFGSQLSQVLELEVYIDNGDATCDCQDDDVTA